MDKRTLDDLEFPILIEQLKSYTLSEQGSVAIDNQNFLFDKKEIDKRQQLINNIIFLKSASDKKVDSFASIEEALKQLEIKGSTLDGEAIFSVASYIYSSIKLIEFFKGQEAIDLPIYNLLDEVDPHLKKVADEIFYALEAPGEVKSSHPAIVKLTQRLESYRKERQQFSYSFLHENSNLVNSDQPVYKDQRVVLPVLSEHKNVVGGIVHSYSFTKATTYIEPFKLVELNNKVAEAKQDLEIEIRKIINELSDKVVALKDQFFNLIEKISYADTLWARGEWAIRTNSSVVLKSDNRQLKIINARHPLLKKRAVPISIDINDGIKGVVFSGPNAGGKTVTMKTIALFVLMHQFFYYIPADPSSTLPLFDSVYTDIGDEQSIENSLSTFSAHMKNISSILKKSNHNSLVLFDELGSATDPTEGVALAQAIIEWCIEKVGLTLISSHHSTLKEYAYVNKSLLNASMAFDDQTNLPTFKIIEGLPGSSYALHTAQSMALPTKIINRAQDLLGDDSLTIATIIKNLEAKEALLDKKLHEFKQQERTLIEEKRKFDLEVLSLKQKERLLKEGQLSSLSTFIKQKRSELENLVAFLREGEINKTKTKKVKEFISSLEEKQKEEQQLIESLQEIEVESDFEFEKGMEVLVGPTKKEGQIIRKERDNSYLVAVGPLKINVKGNELVPVKRLNRKVSISYETKSVNVKPTIDLRGYTLVDAVESVERQLENALVNGVSSFAIIHGLGDGILSKGIHNFLADQKHVLKYYFALSEDGGHGKTYVELG
jgi:DNA mismatch repair protein MutS2